MTIISSFIIIVPTLFFLALVVILTVAAGKKYSSWNMSGFSLRALKWVLCYTAFLLVLAASVNFLPQDKMLTPLSEQQRLELLKITKEASDVLYGSKPVTKSQIESLQAMCQISQTTYPMEQNQIAVEPGSPFTIMVLVVEQQGRSGSFTAKVYNTPLITQIQNGKYVDLTGRISIEEPEYTGDTLRVQSALQPPDRQKIHAFRPLQFPAALFYGENSREEASYVGNGITVLVLEVPAGTKVALKPSENLEPPILLNTYSE